jgi:NAD(P)-dependent dehydrogenase (short-subunit alcohol dehydrogenase family)
VNWSDPSRSPYATTKWGLIGFTKTLLGELGEFGVGVNVILPGAVEGPRIQQVLAARASASGRSVAQEEAATLAVFLASDAGRSISGQMIPIDGDSQSAS